MAMRRRWRVGIWVAAGVLVLAAGLLVLVVEGGGDGDVTLADVVRVEAPLGATLEAATVRAGEVDQVLVAQVDTPGPVSGLGLKHGDEAGGVCRANRFLPSTQVLMADGSSQPIEDVEVGDLVWATDPESGEFGPRRVTDLIVGDGSKDLVEITIGGETITATDGHPFWVDDEGKWIDAEDLEVGDTLRLDSGATVDIDAISEQTRVQRVHNLTVDGIHTYYVLAGEDAVLVHNCGTGWGATTSGLSDDVAPEVVGAMPAKGGVYTLTDDSGAVVRTGRTNDFRRRRAEHHRQFGDELRFNEAYALDDYATQRGLEQVYNRRYATAAAQNEGLNLRRAVGPTNRRLLEDEDAAASFLQRLSGSG